MADEIAIDVTPVITAGINCWGEIIKLTDDELTFLNSPLMVQARRNVAEQALRDQIAKDAEQGLKTGDLDAVERDLS